jgi:Flp pilus assembly protein CpaB
LGASVIGRADNTEPVFVASHPLLPGQRLTTDDLQVVRVRLGAQQGRYLDPAQLTADGAVVIRSVQDGELVPTSAVGSGDSVTSRPVAVPVPAAAAQGLHPGSLVDVWIAAKGDAPQTFDEPKAVVRGAEVVTVSAGGGVLGGSSDASVRLLLADDLVPQVLSAVDNGARVDVVPVPGSLTRSGS